MQFRDISSADEFQCSSGAISGQLSSNFGRVAEFRAIPERFRSSYRAISEQFESNLTGLLIGDLQLINSIEIGLKLD